jgi:hypothetical protein
MLYAMQCGDTGDGSENQPRRNTCIVVTLLLLIAAFWFLTVCSLVRDCERFGGIYRLRLQSEDTFLRNVGNHLQNHI